MTTRGQTRRIAALEARTQQAILEADLAPYVAYYAETYGLSRDDVMTEVNALTRQCAGLTPAETVRWVAGNMGVSVADLEAELAANAEAFARWRQERER